jgi:hypothetical protein
MWILAASGCTQLVFRNIPYHVAFSWAARTKCGFPCCIAWVTKCYKGGGLWKARTLQTRSCFCDTFFPPCDVLESWLPFAPLHVSTGRTSGDTQKDALTFWKHVSVVKVFHWLRCASALPRQAKTWRVFSTERKLTKRSLARSFSCGERLLYGSDEGTALQRRLRGLEGKPKHPSSGRTLAVSCRGCGASEARQRACSGHEKRHGKKN